MRARPFLHAAAVPLLPLALLFALSCSDSGTAPPACSLSTSRLDFDTVAVGDTAVRSFTIANHGSGRLAGTASADSGAFRVVGTAAYSIRPGESAAFTVRCTPTAPGALHGAVSLGSTACGAVTCVATAVSAAPPACRITPGSLDLGSVTLGHSADTTFTVTNVGGGVLSGQALIRWPDCPGFRLVDSPPFALGHGQSTTVTVRFTPDGAGLKTCALHVTGGCPGVDLTGRGVPTLVPAYVELLGDGTYNSNITTDLGLLVLSTLYQGDAGCGQALILHTSGGLDTTGFLLLGCHGCQGLQVDSTVYRVDIQLRNVLAVLGSDDITRMEFHAVAGLCDRKVPLRVAAWMQSPVCDSASVSLSGECLRYRSAGQLPVGLGLLDRTYGWGSVAFTYARFTFQGMEVPLGTPVRRGRLQGLRALPAGALARAPRR